MLADHVVEGGGVKYVCVANDGTRGGREIVGVLLDDSAIVVECKGNTYAESKQGSGEASDAAQSIDGRDLWRERGSRANCDPDVRVSDVKEAKASGVKVEEKVEWLSGGW